MEVTLKGIGVSPGIAIGPACLFLDEHPEIPCYTIDNPSAEIERYDTAVSEARETLREIQLRMLEELGPKHAAIIDGHMEILNDPVMRSEIEERLTEQKQNVEHILDNYIAQFTQTMEGLNDAQFRERALDVADMGRRLLNSLLGRKERTLSELDEPCIVVAPNLSPSQTADMDIADIMGLCTDTGGPTSHMAILARAFELPCVVGLRDVSARVGTGTMTIVDGGGGKVIVDPAAATLDRYKRAKKEQEQQRRALLQATGAGPAMTLDGRTIQTLANIELLAETASGLKERSDGVGLYRSEFLFMNRATLPSEDEQYEAFRAVLERMAPQAVTIRTLDLGGDKQLPGITHVNERNPQLGWRSIRLCLDRPELFRPHLRALLRASAHGELRIMFPMISGVDQFREARAFAEETRRELLAEGVDAGEDVPIGAMIEVPAAVAVADVLALECDFFSIGTNDLIQYALAVDRENPDTAVLYEPMHPGVLRLLKQTIDAARDAKIPCSICGELAGDPQLTEVLLGMGFEALSMSASALPFVRAEIGNTHMRRAKRLAQKVLGMASTAEIKQLLEKRYASRDTLSNLKASHDRAAASGGE